MNGTSEIVLIHKWSKVQRRAADMDLSLVVDESDIRVVCAVSGTLGTYSCLDQVVTFLDGMQAAMSRGET